MIGTVKEVLKRFAIASSMALCSTATFADDGYLGRDDGCTAIEYANEDCCYVPRSTLTGDLFGYKSALEDRGFSYDLYGTQFYQGVAAGGDEQAFDYGGKFDYLLNFDGGRLGLWEGLYLDMHGESRLGQSVNENDGLITATNIAMIFPEKENNITALTGLKVTQKFSESFGLFAGKINTIDEYPLRFNPKLGLGRPGIGGFMNSSLVYNPIVARTIPYSTLGVGAAVYNEDEPLFTFTLLDPRERATIGASNPYEDGVVFVPDLVLTTEVNGLPGILNLGGSYSNAKYQSVDPAAYLFIPNLGVVAGVESGSWNLYANFFQALWVDPIDAERRWGVFGQFGVSDGNPNPIKYVSNVGIAGERMSEERALDTFGAGIFYVGLSDNFKTLAQPVLPQQDEYGAEFFYNLALTHWCRLTADLQVARPSTQGLDTVIIPGLRMAMEF